MYLKGEAHGRGKAREGVIEACIQRHGALGGHQDAGANHGPCLARMHVFHLADVELRALDRQIDRLAACHAEGADGVGQHVDEPQPNGGRVGQLGIARQQLKCKRLQSVAHEKCGRLIISRWQVGRPRRRSSLSIAGRSSCTSEYTWTSSMAQAAASTWSSDNPNARAVANSSAGRMRLPPPKTL